MTHLLNWMKIRSGVLVTVLSAVIIATIFALVGFTSGVNAVTVAFPEMQSTVKENKANIEALRNRQVLQDTITNLKLNYVIQSVRELTESVNELRKANESGRQ